MHEPVARISYQNNGWDSTENNGSFAECMISFVVTRIRKDTATQ